MKFTHQGAWRQKSRQRDRGRRQPELERARKKNRDGRNSSASTSIIAWPRISNLEPATKARNMGRD
jgi:hypothetical protein